MKRKMLHLSNLREQQLFRKMSINILRNLPNPFIMNPLLFPPVLRQAYGRQMADKEIEKLIHQTHTLKLKAFFHRKISISQGNRRITKQLRFLGRKNTPPRHQRKFRIVNLRIIIHAKRLLNLNRQNQRMLIRPKLMGRTGTQKEKIIPVKMKLPVPGKKGNASVQNQAHLHIPMYMRRAVIKIYQKNLHIFDN